MLDGVVRTAAAMAFLGAASAPGADAVLVNRMIAVADNHAITQHALDQQLARLKLREPKLTAEVAEKKALDQLIDEALVADECSRREIKVELSDVDTAVGQYQQENHLSDDEMKEQIRREGGNEPFLRGWFFRVMLEKLATTLDRPVVGMIRKEQLPQLEQHVLAQLRAKAVIEVRK